MTPNQEKKLDDLCSMVNRLDKSCAVYEEKHSNLRENFMEIAKDLVKVEGRQDLMDEDRNKILGGAKVFSIIGFFSGLFATIYTLIKG